MRITSNGSRGRVGRLVGAVLLSVSLVAVSATVSAARPSHQDLATAKAKLDALNRQLDQLVEQYNQARIQLQHAERDLADARDAAGRAMAEADAARDVLSARAAAAYEGAGTEIAAILGSSSMSELTDRLVFVNSFAQQDADMASSAEIKRQEAIRAQHRLDSAIARQHAVLATIADKTGAIKSGIAQQEELVKHIESELARPLNPKPKPVPAPTLSDPTTPPSPAGGDGGGDPPPDPAPPPPSSAAEIAVQAAFSVIGTPYRWGGSDPSTGFDCSGLTMWAWGQAGVSLPHSSSAQYAMLPHVSRDQLQPGDLVFFYHPISHVGIYVGGGMMIHSPHTGSYVEEVSLTGYPDYVGAGRPG